MFCMNCGKQLEDNSKFCPHCGAKLDQAAEAEAVVETAAPVEEPVFVEPPAKTDVVNAAAAAPAQEQILTGKKKGSGAVIAVGVAAVAVVAAVVLLVAGVFASAQSKLGKAVAKSVKAYETVYNDLGGLDMTALAESEKLSQEVSFTLGEVDGDSTLEGLGIRLRSDMDLPGRRWTSC